MDSDDKEFAMAELERAQRLFAICDAYGETVATSALRAQIRALETYIASLPDD